MKYTNREAAERIVSAICNALPYLPDKEDWKKLIDFTENQINRQTAQQSVQATALPFPLILSIALNIVLALYLVVCMFGGN